MYSKIVRPYFNPCNSATQTIRVPCFITADEIELGSSYLTAEVDVRNCLWLEARLESRRPKFLVRGGKMALDFGPEPVGEQVAKTIQIQNVSDKPLHFSGSILNTTGPFRQERSIEKYLILRHVIIFN